MSPPDPELISNARQAAQRAYAKYSGFRVGAAVRAEGRTHTAGNVENASYGLTMCAERAAIFAAIAAGARRIEAIAVSCIDGDANNPASLMPCGACLQVIAEFADASTPVHIDGAGDFTLANLLPHPFSVAGG